MKSLKLFCVALCLCFCFLSFFGCESNKSPVTVDSVAVDKEIYGYYLSVAENTHNYAEEKNKKEIAAELCAEYIAGSRLIDKYEVTLSPEEKVVVASEVKANWQMYSSFYEKYSVSKQTLCRMLEYESSINALVEKLYGKGGEREMPEQEIKAFFNANYVSAKIAFTPFNSEMSQQEVDDITSKYKAMAGILRNGGDFASAIEQYPDITEYEDVQHTISSFDSSYPEGFFKKVAAAAKSSAQTLRYAQGIYLVQKADASELFEVYKSDCIVKMKKDYVLGEIKAVAKEYKTEIK